MSLDVMQQEVHSITYKVFFILIQVLNLIISLQEIQGLDERVNWNHPTGMQRGNCENFSRTNHLIS